MAATRPYALGRPGSGDPSLDFDTLKARHRKIRSALPETVVLRTHRALSWLGRAERETNDDDARFLFLWIAFNAAYAREITNRAAFTERRVLMEFLRELNQADEEHLIYAAVWQHFPQTVRVFLNNQFVFQPFWDYQNGRISSDEWQAKFDLSKRAATRALGTMNTSKVVAILFDRLYVLRNQLVHGGSTWNSDVNRQQVADGVKILAFVVPIVIHLIMSQPDRPWGKPCYPVVVG